MGMTLFFCTHCSQQCNLLPQLAGDDSNQGLTMTLYIPYIYTLYIPYIMVFAHTFGQAACVSGAG